LPVSVIRELVRSSKRRFYERLFTPLLMVWCLVFQRLNHDHTCDAALSYVASGAADHLDRNHPRPLSQRIHSESTAAYCKGRQRLPLSVLKGALAHTARVLGRWLGAERLWLGHRVCLMDGTTFLLRPESALVQHYGRHRGGGKETYWVVMRAVVAFDLHSGAVISAAEGSLHRSEQALAAELLAQASCGDVYVGDRNFGVFSVLQAARHYKAKVLVRLTRQRARALHRGKMHSGADISLSWSPSSKDQQHSGMSSAPIDGRLIFVRLERKGFRPVELYLFTTLLDAERYTVAELVELYGFRWHVELNLRHLKSTLEMDLLTSKSVEMVRKELWSGLLAYNIIRGYMLQAARRAGVSPLTLSFTRCWRRVRDMLFTRRSTDSAERLRTMVERLLTRLAKCVLPDRPRFRVEPRAVRRKPNVYPNLKGSRDR